MRTLIRIIALAAFAGLALTAWTYSLATRDPAVRRAAVEMSDWPGGASPVQVALISDIHVAGPDMPPSRLARIVEQLNRLRPDAVVIAGDLVSDKEPATRRYPAAEGLAPLAGLEAPLGVYAVLGNHDHWRNAAAIAAALKAADVRVLINEALTVGPLRLGGLDDDFTGHADVGKMVAAMRGGRGSPVLLTHSPTSFLPFRKT